MTVRWCRSLDPVDSVKCSSVVHWVWEQFQSIWGKVRWVRDESRTWKRMHLFASLRKVIIYLTVSMSSLFSVVFICEGVTFTSGINS